MGKSMNGKRVLITGGNSGIGKVTAVELAKLGASVVLACRIGDKTIEALKLINATSTSSNEAINLPCDLASLDSVRSVTDRYVSQFDRLDVLINNAGVFPLKRKLTQDGFEMQFGVNHLAHFLLTTRLLDILKSSAPSRVVTVSSMMHKSGELDIDSFRGQKKYSAQAAYRQSKLANVLFAVELAKRLEGTGVTSNVLHPGGVRTGITRDVPWLFRKIIDLMFISPEEGAKTNIMLASDKSLDQVTGQYYDQCKKASCSPLAEDDFLRRRLWQESETLVGSDAVSKVV